MAIPFSRVNRKKKNDAFYQAILLLGSEEECYEFFCDVCTQAELRAMEQRFEVARLLSRGVVYSEIMERTGASSATVSRVARSLSDSTGGYGAVFGKLE